MSDARSRELEREAASGDLDAERAWLRERLRAGELSQAELSASQRSLLDPSAAFVLTLENRSDLQRPAGWRTALHDRLRRVSESWDRILIDGAALTHLFSAEVGALLVVRDLLTERGGELALCSLTPSIREVLDLLGLLESFRVFPDVEACLAETGWRSAGALQLTLEQDG